MANDADVRIKLTANTSQAEGAVKRLQGAFASAARGIGAVTRALGVVGFAIQGVRLVVDAVRTLHAWVTKGRAAAESLRRELEQARYERGVESAVKEYKKLNDEIARTIRLEKERAAIKGRQTAGRRDAEDARLELAKQREIAALDPASEDYVRRKREIEDRYAAKAAGASAARSKEDRDAELEVMKKELAARERQVAGQKASRDADLKEADAARREIEQRERGRAWLNAMGPLGEKEREENEGRIEELEKREKAARSRAEGKAPAIQAAEDAAEILREQIKAALGAAAGAYPRAEASRLAIAQGARERATDERRKEQEKAEAEAKKAQAEAKKAESGRLELAKQKEINGIDIGDPHYEKKRKAIERKYAYFEAEGLNTEEDRKAATLAIDNEIRAEAAAEEQDERQRRIGELGGFADRLAATEGVSQNRLTALGLGSGVDGRAGIAGDVKKIVDLLKEEIAATKDNRPERSDGVAIVGE